MSTDAKRLGDLQEMTPVADAARRVLAVRLEAVRDSLDRSLRTVKERRRSIHALRVATRRATAAIDVFATCLPRRVFKEVRRALQSLRRAVGAARDWDVLLQQLGASLERSDAGARPALDMLHGYALAQRMPAQAQLAAACPDHPFGFDRLMADCVGAVRHRGPHPVTYGSHVRPRIARLVEALDAAAGGGDGDWTQLHEVRILGKRLRYSVELVQDCIGAPLDTHLAPALARLQEILGGVNDSFNASRLLHDILDGLTTCMPDLADRYRDFIERQAVAHEETMRCGREAYRGWLEEWNAAAMQEALRTICPQLRQRPRLRTLLVPPPSPAGDAMVDPDAGSHAVEGTAITEHHAARRPAG